MAKKPKVCIIGAESWGSAISTAVCKNVLNGEFDKRVHIYVYDELVRSSYLSEVMNERHENIKYLPGIKLDDNLIAVNDLVEAAKEADILIFATSHSFLKPYCNILAGKMKSSAYAVSLIKGLDHIRDGEIDLYSHAISNQLKIPCYSVMSANSAMEMAQGKLCEITIGCNNAAHAQQLTNLFQTENCKVFSIDDVDGVELCNTLKDLVALSAGFIDGLRLGDNARVACLHLGLKEMMRFIKAFNPTTKLSTFFESCGVANSVASSYADKNVTFAKSFVTTRKTVQEIEANLLNGRKLLGPVIAGEVHAYLERAKLQSEYPLFTILHRICQNEVPPDAILETLRNHPDFSNCSITRLQKEEYSMPNSDTDSVLENLADTVPEHSSISLDNAISRHSIANPFDSFNEKEAEFLEPFQQYFKIPNTNMELNEFLEKCQKSSMTAIAAIDDPNPNDGHVEYSFEIESAVDKPEIYLKLKDITTNPITDQIDQERETNQSICNAVGSSNLISELPKDSTEFLSMKGGQSAEMSASGSGSNKSDAGKASPLVGLTNIIERHVRPYNEKFKALKVRVKLTNDDQKSKDKKSTKNKEINQSSVGNSATLLDSKTVDSEPLEEIPGKRTKINVNAKEEVLYDKDSEYSDDPQVMKLIDMIRIKEELNQEQEVKELKKVEETKDIKITSTELDQSNENVFPINQGGYTVDYLKVVRPKKESLENTSDFVPLQYPMTDNSYRLDHSPNDQLPSEDSKNTPSTVSENSDKKSTETLEFNNQEHIDDPGLELRGTDMDQAGLEDQQKLKMAQEFLDKQATLIKNLVMETASSDNLNNLNNEAKKEPNLSCAKLEDPKFWLDYPKKAEMHESLLEPVEQSRKQTHKDQSNVESDQKLEVKEVLAQDDHESIMRDEKPQVLPEDQHHDKTLKVETKAVENHNDFDRILSNESQNDFDKILSNENCSSGDEETEGKPKLADDQHSLGLAQKKNQTHGLEDPNLRFYHAKNDGEQGPEWNWLLDEDNSEQRSKQKTILSENQDQDPHNYRAVPISDENKPEVPKSKEKTILTEAQDQDPPISDEDKAEVPKSSKNKSRLTLRRKKIEDLALKEDHHEKYASASLSSSVPSLPMDSQHKESSNSQFIEALIEKTMAEQIISEESEAMSQKKTNDKHEKLEETLFELNAEKTEEISQKDFKNKTTSKPKISELHSEESEEISQKDFKNKTTSKPKISELHSEKSAEMSQNDFKNKTTSKPKISELLSEESEEISQKDSKQKKTVFELNAEESEEISQKEYKKKFNTEEITQDDYKKKMIIKPSSVFELNAQETEEDFKQELRMNEEIEIAEEDYKEMKTKPTSAQIVSDKIAEENNQKEIGLNMEEFAEEDSLYKEMKTPMSEEMLLDEEASYKAILDEDAKFGSSQERERLEQEEVVEGKYELKKPETETEKETETQLSTLMSRGQTKERAVNYKGTNPYIDQMNILPESTDITNAMANDTESERRMRKRTVLRPSFHPPINPRVRIPRPPFDVRDHEYHTVNYRPPPDLLRHAALPKRRLPLPVAYNQAKQVSVSVSASNVAKLPRPVMRLPSSVMRSSVLAVEVGLFAAFFTRYSK